MMKLLEDKDRKEEVMTREERLDWLCRLRSGLVWFDVPPKERPVFEQVLSEVIKDLEQEPCEDAVSRQALIERINNAEENFKADNMESIASDDGNPFVDGVLSGVFNIREMVAQAPSVTPTTCIAKVTFDKDELQKIVDEKVKELPVTQKWIPVSERLPEEKGFYLVSVKNEHDRRYTKSCWFYGNGKWFARQEVIAWMPLPEPYKAEGSEKE